MITLIHSKKSYLTNLLLLGTGFTLVAIPSYLGNILTAETLTAAAIAALLGQATGSLRIEHAEPQRATAHSGGSTSTLYVGNLVYRTSKDDLIELFRPYGDVISARIILDRDTRKSKGYGFVELNARSAERAINDLNGLEIQGRTLRVTEAKDR